jgi:hypothetical protein
VLGYIEGNNSPLRELGEEGAISGGVFDHSTYAEDGLVPWEALASPRRYSGLAERRCPVSDARHVGGRTGRRPLRAQHKHPPRGRLLARGTGAVADRGRASEGGIRALTSGNRVSPWTRPSTGGPCRGELLKGPLANALTLRDMSPGLQEVVGRQVATSHIGGGAGWWKSPRPDLARGRDGQPPGLLYNGILSPAPPAHNPENTSGPPSVARRRCRLPRHATTASRSGAQQGVARQCAVWTYGAEWVTVAPHGFLGAQASERPVGSRTSRLRIMFQDLSRSV